MLSQLAFTKNRVHFINRPSPSWRRPVNKVNSLKQTSQHKGYSLKKRLNSLHSNLQLFLQQLKSRQNLSKHNTAILLHQQTVSARKIQLEQERIKLQSILTKSIISLKHNSQKKSPTYSIKEQPSSLPKKTSTLSN